MIPESDRLKALRAVAWRIFGGRFGLLVFLCSVVLSTLLWRVGFFINDNYTLANTLVAVADGHLDVRSIQYGPESGATPGMHLVDGRLYGRAYGTVFFALPFLWAIKVASIIVDIQIAIVAFWCLAILGIFLIVGDTVDHRRSFGIVGSVVSLALFGLNVSVATNLSAHWYPLLALQLSTIVAAALTAVLLYHLLSKIHDQKTGAVAGLLVGLSSPLVFWSSIPKRHIFTGLLVLLALYAFYESRARTDGKYVHATAYGAVAAVAWIHAAEGLMLFVALFVADLVTMSQRDWQAKRVAVVGGGFFLALLPTIITNILISGHPLYPPNLLPGYHGEIDALAADGNQSTTSSSAGQPDSGGNGGDQGGITAGQLFTSIRSKVEPLKRQLSRNFAVLQNFDRLYHIFVRSGWLGPDSIRDGSQAIYLSVLESFPLLSSLLVAPLYASWQGHDWESLRSNSAERATDVLAITITGSFLLLYLPELPTNAMVTARYIVPLFPVALYGVVRLSLLHHVIQEPAVFLWTYAIGVLIGGQLIFVWVLLNITGLGEAVQFHALLNLGTAVGIVLTLTSERVLNRTFPRMTTGAFALAAAAGTLFSILSRVWYFETGTKPVLPLVRLAVRFIDLV